ncbi:MAG: TRCF domain-containing protein, partial [Bacteroidota bacterium]
HQMRGRVGRTNKKAFCYLLTPPFSTLTQDARRRLKAIEEFSDLGSGFNISMRDLDIRGAGNLLGGEQSGFISEIGFEMYHKILDEALQELKQEEFKEHFNENQDEEHNDFSYVSDCVLETDLQLLIPSDYVENTQERLSLYKDLDNLNNEEELEDFVEKMKDRFGPVPEETSALFLALKTRWMATKLGFEKIILKSGRFIAYFVSDQESPYFQSAVFTRILSFVQNNPLKSQIRESNKKLSLSVRGIDSIEKACEILKKMQSEN